jgi:hypothetical protein
MANKKPKGGDGHKGKPTAGKTGHLRPDGMIQVGSKTLTPFEARKQKIQLGGFWEQPAPVKKKSFWKAHD